MNAVTEAVARLDADCDLEGVSRYLTDCGHDINIILHAAYELIVAGRIRAAYIIAMMMNNAGMRNPVTSLALAIGGMTFGNPENEARGLAMLQLHADGIGPEQSAVFYTAVLEPVVKRLLNGAFIHRDNALTLRILNVLTAGTPHLRAIFDLDAPIPTLSLEEMRRRGRERSRLLTYPTPPAGAARPPRNAVVAIRELFFPNQPGSRPLDLGPRLVAGMEDYGWRTRFVGLPCADLRVEYRTIAELCRAHEAEILVLDDNLLEAEYARFARADMIADLRRELPRLKIVSILFDTWALTPEVMVEGLAGVDCVWDTTSPSLALWQEPVFAGKVLHLQVPHARNDRLPAAPLEPCTSFRGGVKAYNWHRAFWLAAAEQLGLPVEHALSSHQTDGLPALDSYAIYMRQLAEAPCSLNLSMRSDLTRIVTGRCFETIVSGSLLLQEATPDMDYYFTAGEHYLEFGTVAELAAVLRFIDTHRDEAEEIRRAGNAFARERYSDERLIAYLDKRLFHPD